MTATRLDQCFQQLKQQQRAALVTFTMGGDPDAQTSLDIINTLAASGADIIEIGMPFSDPAADGPTIQLAGQRALDAGTHLAHILAIVKQFRGHNQHTPVILMGYYNPILTYGIGDFVRDSYDAGVDGFIVVDLPPEEDTPLFASCTKHNLSLIKLLTPTTTPERLQHILPKAGGFLYYVSIAGITGTKAPSPERVKQALDTFRPHTSLPLVVGFGIKTAEQAKAFASLGEGIVIGSALCKLIEEHSHDHPSILHHISRYIGTISEALKESRVS